jgi:hypothetical protein
MSKQKQRTIRELLPWYVNGTLPTEERQLVEAALADDPILQTELAAWRRLRAHAAAQPRKQPPIEVQRRLLDNAHHWHESPAWLRWWQGFSSSWSGVVAATLLVLLVLWVVVQPGVVLQWSVDNAEVSTFRVYRAPAGSTDFRLVKVVSARPGVEHYTYIDALLLPGQTCLYMVEGISAGGELARSQMIAGSGQQALPGQLALVLTSVILGCMLVIFLRYLTGPRRSFQTAT